MIINLIEEKTNQLKVPYKDEGTSALWDQSFSTKSSSDVLSWKVINKKIYPVFFTVISNSRCLLNNINYILPEWMTLANGGNYKIETSIDYINWYELPYNDGEKYVFYETDQHDNITYLYDNYEFQMIRFTFFPPDTNDASTWNEVKFISLEILVEESFDPSYIKKNLLSIRSSMFSKPKIYIEYPFLPDIINSYMSMLEKNNSLGISKEYKNTYFQKTTFDLVVTEL